MNVKTKRIAKHNDIQQRSDYDGWVCFFLLQTLSYLFLIDY